MEDLLSKGADKTDLAEIIARLDALDHLRTELADAATLASVEYHPAILVRWCGILGQCFVSGDGRVHQTAHAVTISSAIDTWTTS